MRKIIFVFMVLVSFVTLAQEPTVEQPTAEPVTENPANQAEGDSAESDTPLESPSPENTPSSQKTSAPSEEATGNHSDNEALEIAAKDLNEQRRMADGTESIQVSSWFQVGIGIAAIFLNLGGLVFIYFTLKATEKSADTALAASKQTRAWLWINQNKTAVALIHHGTEASVSFQIFIENFGKSPSLIINFVTKWKMVPGDCSEEQINNISWSEGTSPKNSYMRVFPGNAWQTAIVIPPANLKKLCENKSRMHFYISISYKSEGFEEIFETELCVALIIECTYQSIVDTKKVPYAHQLLPSPSRST